MGGARWLGRIRWRAALELQEEARRRLLGGDESAATLILCEHDPVITLGRAAPPAHVLLGDGEAARLGIEVERASRGGDVTYHGPGQLMVYPVVRLRRGAVAYLEAIAGALAEAAAELGVGGAAWRRCPAGLWAGERKLAACGIHVSRGVAVHGFSFNVSTPPAMWQHIVPCGMAPSVVTSLADELAARGAGAPPRVAEVAALAAPHLVRALGLPAS